MNTQRKTLSTSLGLVVLRLILGVILVAHGWQKYAQFTLAGTTAAFEQMGVPLASVLAPLAATLELAGGIALILGLATRVVAVLLAADLLGALFMVHLPAGLFVDNGGYELVAILAAACSALALAGPGGYSLDRLIVGWRSGRTATVAA